MKKNKRKFKLEIPHIHLIADTLILVLGIFLGAFLYAQLAPKATVNKPSITVQGIATSLTCGNEVCETTETITSCPTDCFCGNGTCDTGEYNDEDKTTTCPTDCKVAQAKGVGGGCNSDFDTNCGAGKICCSQAEEICLNPNTAEARCIRKLDLDVYLFSPTQSRDHSGNLITTIIKGQQKFIFYINPVSEYDRDNLPNYIDENQTKVVLINSDSVIVKELYCVKDLNQTPYEEGVRKLYDNDTIPPKQVITTYCDTLALANSNVDLKVRLWPKSASGTTLPLNAADGIVPLYAEEPTEEFVNFLKFRIDNTGVFNFQAPPAPVFGNVAISATISNAKVLGVNFKIHHDLYNETVGATESTTTPGLWQKRWMTMRELPPNDNYTIVFVYKPIDPNVNEMNPSLSRTVSLQNTDTNCGKIEMDCTTPCTCTTWKCNENKMLAQTCCDICNTCKTFSKTPSVTNNNCQVAKCVACTNQVAPCEANWQGYQAKTCDDECGGRQTAYSSCDPASNCTITNECGVWTDCGVNGEKTQNCKDTCDKLVTVTAQCEVKTSAAEPTVIKPSITYPTANLEISDPQPQIKGTAAGGSLVRLYWTDANGKTAQSPDLIMVPSTNTFSYVLPWPLTDGTYKIYMEAFPSTGATGVKTESVSFKILPPEVVMLSPQANQQLTGSVTLTAEVKKGEIYTLDFNLDKVGGYTDHLISKATVQANNKNVWQYIWDTSATDNGEYDIYAKIKDAAKVKIYSSNKIRVKINNNIPSLPEPSKPSAEETKPTTDTDNDGLPDILEKKLGSDPNNADSNGDGISDSVSVEQGKSPIGDVAIKPELIKEAQEQIAEFKADEPKYGGVLNKDLQISSIVSVAVEVGREGILIQGKGPPNTILTIYIYSRPIVVTTKTDENGNFSYVLEKDIAEGEHEVYVTVTDETGKVQQKGEPFSFFVKKARAVTRDEYFRGDVNVEQKAPPVLKTYIILCLGIVLAVLIGFVVYRIIKGPEKPSQRIRLKEDTGIKSK